MGLSTDAIDPNTPGVGKELHIETDAEAEADLETALTPRGVVSLAVPGQATVVKVHTPRK